MQAILGTRTSADINLVAQLLLLSALWVGFYFAHTHQIPKHRNVQTTVVLANVFFIAFIMVTSFYSYVILGGTTSGTVAVLMIIHGTLGLIAELTGIYLVLRMRTQIIPPRFRVRNFKLVMRSLLGLWTAVVLLGLGIFYFRYLTPAAGPSGSVSPVALLQRGTDDIAIHADEMHEAVQRANLTTAKRHAEHLVNLIEGKNGGDYGDVDKDGVVQDPGDGVGTLNYLAQVRKEAATAGGGGAASVALADQLQIGIVKIASDALAVARANDLNAVAAPSLEAATLANQMDTGTANSVPQLAQMLNASTALPTVAAPNVVGTANNVTIDLQDFQFSPKTITIQKGAAVTFENLDNVKHTATSDDAKFDSRDIGPGGHFTFTFDQAGSFPYHCVFHGDKGGVDMAGTIVVQ